MRMLKVAAALTLLAGIPVAPSLTAQPAAAPPPVPVSKGERFRQGLAELQRRYRVPAFSVAVYSPRGLEAAEAIGVRRIGEPVPVELSDRFFIGSITKPMTSTLAASMVDSGLIAWSTTPADVWPSEAPRMHPALRNVTLAQLLSHRAGIQPYTQDSELVGVPAVTGSPREQRATFTRWLLSRPPASAVGAHVYSNAGFALAAAMLEQKAGKGWEELIRERVFQPLGMTSCGFGWPRTTGDQPHAHRFAGGRYVAGGEAGTAGLPPSIAPAGDVHCSMADLGRFGEAHMLGLLGRPGLLRTETFRALHTGADDYALGWGLHEIGSTHRGGVSEGWHALLFVSPSRQIVVAFAVNAREPGKTDELMTEVTQLAFDIFAIRSSPR